MGVVYRAHDERLDRDVALKVLPPGSLADESARKRFHHEALALARLNHPNIATIHDFDTQEGVDFLVMEYVQGVTLADKLRAGGLPEKQALALGEQIAKALRCAHEMGMVHRDLKPGNIMVTASGEVKLLDFGISLLLKAPGDAQTETITKLQNAFGTLPYMAPEQLAGQPVDERCDIYALGVVLHEIATGKRPFESKTPTVLIADILCKPPTLSQGTSPQVSPALVALILKCLEKDPDNRYQSARELLVDLRRAGLPIPQTSDAHSNALRRFVTLAIIALSAITLIFVSNLVRRRDQFPDRKIPSIKSLAVLPFENLSHDPAQEYFADGITEELITELSKISTLRVISRTSAMHYKDSSETLPEISRELRVDAVVEGSVLRSRDRVRITAQLISGAADNQLWAQTYDRDIRDILILQSEVAQAIVQEIRIKVTPQEQGRLQRSSRVDPHVHEAYLKGRYYWNKRTPEAVQKGLQYFRQAIERDPAYAPAYAGLADSYDLLGTYRVLPPNEARQMAESAARTAVNLDSNLAEAHVSLAAMKFFYLQWEGVDEEFRRAIELDPGYATAHHWYALYLAANTRNNEAISEIKRARELDPLSLIINANVGWCFYLNHQYDQAIAEDRAAIDLDPNFAVAHEYLGQAYLEKRLYANAISELQKAANLSQNEASVTAELGNAYATAGRKKDALRILTDVLRRFNEGNASAYDVALIYAGLADKDQTVQWLNNAAEGRNTGLVNIKVHPRFEQLRKDLRFQLLLARLGLLGTG